MVEGNPMAMFGERGPKEGRAVAAVRFHPTVAMLAVAALLAGGPAVLASTLTFKAELSGGGEAPPNNSAGKGHVSATLDTDTKTLTWTVTYSGVTGAPIGAHFHGPVSYVGMTSEENAPIQVGTPGSLASPFKGSSTIDDTQMQDLKNGRWYFNLHTPKFPAGEIRGPVVRQ
jgi:CHRD domain